MVEFHKKEGTISCFFFFRILISNHDKFGSFLIISFSIFWQYQIICIKHWISDVVRGTQQDINLCINISLPPSHPFKKDLAFVAWAAQASM